MTMTKELEIAIKAASEAAKHIRKIYDQPFEIEIKDDNSPVTAADKGADEIIRKIISEAFPEDCFLTEESADTDDRFSSSRVWIVDPVDGTKEFVSKNGEFVTNIALSIDGQIALGIIFVPLTCVCYYAIKGEGSYRLEPDGTLTRLHVSERRERLIPMRSISHFRPNEEEYMKANKDHFDGEPRLIGSALKFARLAEGVCDFFARLSNGTKEWDVASGDLIVTEAGGFFCKPNGDPISYNKRDVYNREGYIMANAPADWMFVK